MGAGPEKFGLSKSFLPALIRLNIKTRSDFVSAAVYLALLYFVSVLPFLGLAPIGGSSEAREAHVVQVMVREGRWFLPTRNGLIPSKPPLYHWVAAVAAKVADQVDEFIVRLPSLFFATLLLGLVIMEAGELARQAKSKSPLIGLGAVFILSTTYGFANLALDSRVDMTAAFFINLALLTISRSLGRHIFSGYSGENVVGKRSLAMFYLWCALAVLAKGPLGLVLPALVCFVWLAWLSGVKKAFLIMSRPNWGWFCFMALVLPWYAWAAYNWGAAFWGRQLLFENLDRFIGGADVNSESPWFYVPSFLRSACPWSLLFVFFVIREARLFWPECLQPASRASKAAMEMHPCARLALMRHLYLIWFGVGFVFFSLASGKRHSYLLPLYPAMSLYLTSALQDWLSTRSERLRGEISGLAAKASGAAAALALLLVLALQCIKLEAVSLYLENKLDLFRPGLFWLQAKAWMAQCLLLVCMLFYLLYRRRYSGLPLYIAGWLTVVAMLTSIIAFGRGIKAELKGFKMVAAEINQRLGELTVIRTTQDELFDPVLFYLNRRVRLAPPEASSVQCENQPLGAEKNRHFYLSRESFLNDLLKNGAAKLKYLVVEARFIERSDLARKRTDRRMVLFSCRP